MSTSRAPVVVTGFIGPVPGRHFAVPSGAPSIANDILDEAAGLVLDEAGNPIEDQAGP